MLDRACPTIIEQVLPHLPGSEKVSLSVCLSVCLSVFKAIVLNKIMYVVTGYFAYVTESQGSNFPKVVR